MEYIFKYFNKYNKLLSNVKNIKNKMKTIIFVLKSGCSWRHLNELGNLKYDESTYRKFYYKLVNLGIINNILATIQKLNTSNVMFIDSSNIRNKLGDKDSIGFCPQDKKHKGNKISVICNDKGKIVNCYTDRGSVHDLKMFDKTILNLNCKVIIGDKGYTSNTKKTELKNKGIKLLYPYKKIVKKINNVKEKKLLKRRHIVENSICSLKQYRKLNNRYERKLKYFDGFIKLGIILLLIK